eukprot:TRINITY_DN16565_c0_g1_i1.p1 TRINITY_DN16565_c0_g1~~TRINITY_DN16565_c0_g1_i1.p1  ORF type:complete len:479 (-),score=81.48 TRINITY_DN16565_c0_g1_i1:31-1467(-)
MMPEKSVRSISSVIEDIGYGPSQYLTALLVNGSWLADGSELLVLSSIASSLRSELGLSRIEEGSLMTAVYFGVLVGNFASGYIGDSFGRRSSILVCFPSICLCSALSAFAQNFWQLLLLRLLVGLGFGTGQPSAVAILLEVSPLRYRTLNQGLAQMAFAVGELYCCALLFLDDPTMTKLNWRYLLVASALPALVFWLLSLALLDESPAFLAATGKRKEAEVVLDRMQARNGKDNVCTMLHESVYSVQSEPLLQQMPKLISWMTAALCAVSFSYNFTVYAAFSAFPQLIPKLLAKTEESAVATLAKGALAEIPSDLVGLLLCLALPRKYVLYLYFIGFAASCFLFSCESIELMLPGYYGMKAFPQVGSMSLFVLAAESYPTEVRARGTALVLSCGRIGALVAPVAYVMWRKEHGYESFFGWGCGSLMLVCLLLTYLLVSETFSGTWLFKTEAETEGVDERLHLADELALGHGAVDSSAK